MTLETSGADLGTLLGADPPPPSGAAIANPGAVEEIRSRRGGARPGAGRKKGSKPKAEETTPPVESISPEMYEALKPQLVEAYQLALSVIAVYPVVFNEPEKLVVGSGLIYCIETYLPAGFTKHAPAFALVAVSLQAVMRARAEKAALAKEEKKK